MNSRYLDLHLKLKDQRNWLKQVWTLKFWSEIICFFMHWTKKLTLDCVLLSLHTSSESLKLLSSKHPFPGHSTSMLTKLRLQARSCMRPLTICNTLSGSQVWFAERGGNICKNNWVLGTYTDASISHCLPQHSDSKCPISSVNSKMVKLQKKNLLALGCSFYNELW